jgi:hypothetical protein
MAFYSPEVLAVNFATIQKFIKEEKGLQTYAF